MLKKAMFVLCTAVFVVAMAGCDSGTTSGSSGGAAATLPEGIEPFTPPQPGEIPTRERPGSEHGKSSSSGN